MIRRCTCFLFQSTLPREERQFCSLSGSSLLSRFQSTLPREERPLAVRIFLLLTSFQSTLPREERLRRAAADSLLMNFNPRSHERSDGHDSHRGSVGKIFQSTLPREERR